MVALYIQIAERLHRLTMAVCMMCFCVMAISTLSTVVLRYAFSSGFLWLQDLGVYSFGLLAILAIPATWKNNRHIRVDVFRQNQSAAKRGFIDRTAIIGFVFPLFLLLLVYAYGDAATSFLIGEGSPQIGGLPYFYIVKAVVPLAAFLMLVQSGAILLYGSIEDAEAV